MERDRPAPSSQADCDSALLAAGGPEAFGIFYRRNYDIVQLWLRRRLGDQADVEELVSEVFLAAMVGRDRFDPARGPARAWLWGLTRVELLRWRRSEIHRAALVERQTTPPGRDESSDGLSYQERIDRRVDEKPILRRLQPALAALPASHRSALELRMAEYSYGEIAAALGCSTGAARVRVHRALAALRRAVPAV